MLVQASPCHIRRPAHFPSSQCPELTSCNQPPVDATLTVPLSMTPAPKTHDTCAEPAAMTTQQERARHLPDEISRFTAKEARKTRYPAIPGADIFCRDVPRVHRIRMSPSACHARTLILMLMSSAPYVAAHAYLRCQALLPAIRWPAATPAAPSRSTLPPRRHAVSVSLRECRLLVTPRQKTLHSRFSRFVFFAFISLRLLSSCIIPIITT